MSEVVTIDIGWTFVLIAWIFAAGIILFCWWMGRRLNRIREKVKGMNADLDKMNKMLHFDIDRIKELLDQEDERIDQLKKLRKGDLR